MLQRLGGTNQSGTNAARVSKKDVSTWVVASAVVLACVWSPSILLTIILVPLSSWCDSGAILVPFSSGLILIGAIVSLVPFSHWCHFLIGALLILCPQPH